MCTLSTIASSKCVHSQCYYTESMLKYYKIFLMSVINVVHNFGLIHIFMRLFKITKKKKKRLGPRITCVFPMGPVYCDNLSILVPDIRQRYACPLKKTAGWPFQKVHIHVPLFLVGTEPRSGVPESSSSST